jgi:hypothetical protein
MLYHLRDRSLESAAIFSLQRAATMRDIVIDIAVLLAVTLMMSGIVGMIAYVFFRWIS